MLITFSSEVFFFGIPEKWKADFDKLTGGKANEISDDYKQELKSVFPKLSEKFDTMFTEIGGG
jgi:hypothetical protein